MNQVISIKRTEEFIKYSSFTFGLETPERTYYMYPDTEEEQRTWITMLTNILEKFKGKNGNTNTNNVNNTNTDTNNTNITNTNVNSNTPIINGVSTDPGSNISVREKLILVKDTIPVLNSPATIKLFEFWKAWFDSIPSIEETRLTSSDPICFDLITSANMSKLVWRCCGHQNAYIQKMVDFFWVVGSPSTEIERLNEIGGNLNPDTIGSWITVSNKGGMDGGWFFPVITEISLSSEVIDAGDAKSKLLDWFKTNGITNILSIGRDMGAHPPRQTELRFALPGNTYEEKISKALNAFDTFQCSRMPSDALEIIKEKPKEEVLMNIVISSMGFVQVGLILPSPDDNNVNKLCALCGSSYDSIKKLQETIRVNNPSYVEFQFLMTGFGYGVYKEGFDVFFHYKVGEEK